MWSYGKLVSIKMLKLVSGRGTDLILMDESVGNVKASD